MATKQEPKTEIRATREQWEAVTNRWLTSRHGNERGTDLLERQFPLYFKLKENIKSLNGEPVLVFKNSNGSCYSHYPYRGMILNAKELGSSFILTVFFNKTDHETWNGDRVETVQLFRVDIVRPILPTLTNEQKIEMKFSNLLNKLNSKRNENVLKIEGDIRNYKETIITLQKDVEHYERRLTDLEDTLKKTKVDNITLEGMLDSFRQLGKNKKVFNAYVRDDNKMVVETEMIYATSPKTNKEDRRKKVGRLVFELTTEGIDYCKFINLDYCYHSEEYLDSHYYLPNVNDQILCYGNNGTLLTNLAKSGSFYELVDFLILFFSLFPHDSGVPYINHGQWMKGRVRELKPNPFNVAANRKLWELYPGKVYAQSKEEKKAKLFAELEDFATTRQAVAPIRPPLVWHQAEPDEVPEPTLATPLEGIIDINGIEIDRYLDIIREGITETPNNTATEERLEREAAEEATEEIQEEALNPAPTDPRLADPDEIPY